MIDVAVSGRPGHAAKVRMGPGGSAANAAVWAATCGAEATAIGRVGDDAAGRMLAAELEARGVRAQLVVDPDAPTGTFVTVGGAIWADRGTNARYAPGHLPAALEADAVLVSGYLPRAVAESALARTRAPWIALDAARLDDLPRGGNILFANEEEAFRLTGQRAEQAALGLGERYDVVCVTRGPAGAVAAFGGKLESAASPALPALDATGAGDAFAAGVLVALARGVPLAQALAEGCMRGARAAGTAGPWPVLK
jgi:sugar/nucleoside kinase (ribokinase family)